MRNAAIAAAELLALKSGIVGSTAHRRRLAELAAGSYTRSPSLTRSHRF